MSQIEFESIYAADEFFKHKTESVWSKVKPDGTQRNRPRVLVVDDQKLIVDTIAEILKEAGFHVMAAYDGWTALEAASSFRPDYLLSDVLMPRMNGVELAIAVRKMHPAAKILLFSGQAGISEILDEGKRQGFEFELVAKPIHPLKLIELLRNKPQ